MIPPDSDPEGMSLLARVIAAAAAVIAPSWVGWNWLDKRFARRHVVADSLQIITNEVGIQRGHVAKLFDKLEEHKQRDEQLFREIMTRMGDNHSEIMRELGRKADR